MKKKVINLLVISGLGCLLLLNTVALKDGNTINLKWNMIDRVSAQWPSGSGSCTGYTCHTVPRLENETYYDPTWCGGSQVSLLAYQHYSYSCEGECGFCETGSDYYAYSYYSDYWCTPSGSDYTDNKSDSSCY